MSVLLEDSALVDAVIEAPDTVRAGVSFEAGVTTVGLSGCWRADGAEQTSSARVAAVTPYDRDDTGGSACAQQLVPLPRTVAVTFDSLGWNTLRVHGRRITDGAGSALLTVEKQIWVR